MSYNKTIWVNDETEVNAENMNHIENGIEGSYNITLLAVSDVEPTECEVGDKYYNTEDKVIYTATATDTWGSIGETPISDTLYVVFDEKNTYAWDNTDLVSVGGGSGSEIVIEPDEPTEDTKLIIEESDLDFQGLPIKNEKDNSTDATYSCDFVNSYVGDLIKSQEFSRTISQSANTIDYWTLSPTINVPTGYVFAGITVGTGASGKAVTAFSTSGTTTGSYVYATISTGGDSTTNKKVSCYAIYIREG